MIALSPEIYRMVKKTLFSGANKFLDLMTMEHLCQWPAHMSTNQFSGYGNKGILTSMYPQRGFEKPLRRQSELQFQMLGETLVKHMTRSPATADGHDALFNQRQIAMPVANLISSVMEKSCPGRVNTSIQWPRRELLAIESTSAQNKEDCQEQTASLLNK